MIQITNQYILLKYIVYLDENNFPGYAMSKFFAKGVFKWTALKQYNLLKYNKNCSKGFVLKVHLE